MKNNSPYFKGKMMINYNKNNDVVKYKYLEFIEHSEEGKDPKTVKQFADAIYEFEVATGFKDFKGYNSDWAIVYKDYLNDKRNKQTGLNISKSYLLHYVSNVRNFLTWIRENIKGYSKIKKADISYMHVRRNEKNQARAVNLPESHSVKDIISTIRKMPDKTIIEERNKAMISLFLLCCPRISSLQESRVEHIRYFEDYNSWAYMQDPRFSPTKGNGFIKTFFVGEVQDLIDNVINWKQYLESQGRKNKDYLFPKITPSFTKSGETEMLFDKDYIKSQTIIRNIVKKAYEANGLKYIKPHNFRHSIARHVRKSNNNVTDTLIALAENMGQKNGYSTLVTSYAGDPLESRAKLMKAIVLE